MMKIQELVSPDQALLIAIVIPCYNESESLEELILQLKDKFQADSLQRTCSYRFVLVDDGSTDTTWQQIQAHCNLPGSPISGIKLSRNFGHQKALLAGLEYAVSFCDYVITMDADLQHPIEAAKEMLEMAIKNNHNIVLGQRYKDQHSTLFKRSTSRLFYKLMNSIGAELTPDVSDFRVMDKQSASALVSHGDNIFFTRGIISLIGFNQAIYQYKVAKRFAGTSKYSLKKMLKFASEGITSLSISPLRLNFIVSLILFAICGLVLIYSIRSWLMGTVVSGWTSIIVSIYVLFGINFLLIGILGEYVGKIYFQSLKRPRYIIQKLENPWVSQSTDQQ